MNKYQGDVLRIEKLNPDKTYTALYWDSSVKSFYVKRFSFALSDNTPVCFISDSPKSYLVAISDDKYPQYEVTWKLEDKQPEAYDAEAWIGKKGVTAKGKKCVERGEVKSVRFIEPLIKEEPEAEEPEVEEPEVVDIMEPDFEVEDVAGGDPGEVGEELFEELTLF